MSNQRAKEFDKFAVVARIAAEVGSQSRLGKKAMQKLVHIVSDLGGVPLGYRFTFYTYGPFSKDLAGDLDVMDVMQGIEVKFDSNAGSYQIRKGEKSDYFLRQGNEFLHNHKDAIDNVISTFGSRTASDLELLSSIIFLRKYGQRDKSLDGRILVERVKELKPKYSEKQIEIGIADLDGFVGTQEDEAVAP